MKPEGPDAIIHCLPPVGGVAILALEITERAVRKLMLDQDATKLGLQTIEEKLNCRFSATHNQNGILLVGVTCDGEDAHQTRLCSSRYCELIEDHLGLIATLAKPMFRTAA